MSWPVIIAIGIATYALRVSFLFAFPGGPPPAAERALQFVPVAVLPALACSAIIGDGQGPLDLRFAAAIVAVVVAWRTHSALLSMASGMLALWFLQAWG